ncbi:hypothetical protein [Lichenibacterium dinghuense]|uniref:hypothetical protein n=1 Tax=Lichenibacterium dinghuense TaxID=2895977 RepID=UPI001F315A70|nr:hypothetical protein [Lichenibacterium sp. 6Y81]
MNRVVGSDAAGPTARDRDRYAAALAGAADPELLFGPVLASFRRLTVAVSAGDRAVAARAAVVLERACLALCVVPAASAAAADDRRRVANIVAAWAWPRRPALAAVLAAGGAQEARRWGGEVAGEA